MKSVYGRKQGMAAHGLGLLPKPGVDWSRLIGGSFCFRKTPVVFGRHPRERYGSTAHLFASASRIFETLEFQ